MYKGRKEDRQKEALARKEAREARGDKGQVERLNQIFGQGKGAQRERARLQIRLRKQS